MSQAKVNEYKEYKKNKKQVLAKQKRKKLADKIIIWVVSLAVACGLIAALAVTFRNMYRDYKASLPDYNVSSYVLDDLSGIAKDAEPAE